MIPAKLKSGDEVRVISPSTSMSTIKPDALEVANSRLEGMGLKVGYSAHAQECDEFSSSSTASRIADLHAAFSDNSVKAILAARGGFNSNQLLSQIDFDLIKRNPKILCGYSDITTLTNAIYAKTGLVTYSGPNYSSFGMKYGFDYSLEYFKKAVLKNSPKEYEIHPSEKWSDDRWSDDQEKREFIKNTGTQAMQFGEATGTIIGSNLSILNGLQGTEFLPSLENSILFIEDDHISSPALFDHNMQSLILQPGFEGVKGICIGRFQKASNMTTALLERIISTKKELKEIPVISELDFGHTSPQFTFPIGGKARIISEKGNAKLEILEH